MESRFRTVLKITVAQVNGVGIDVSARKMMFFTQDKISLKRKPVFLTPCLSYLADSALAAELDRATRLAAMRVTVTQREMESGA